MFRLLIISLLVTGLFAAGCKTEGHNLHHRGCHRIGANRAGRNNGILHHHYAKPHAHAEETKKMSRLPFALPALLAGCVAYEPTPIDWTKEAAALDEAPRQITLSVEDVRVRTVAFSPTHHRAASPPIP